MSGLRVKLKGDYDKTKDWLRNLEKMKFTSLLEDYGQKGVDALSAATPRRTGITATSWSYEIVKYKTAGWQLIWKNSNINKNVNIAIILDHGHGTGTGGYVQGLNYIDPALTPVIEELGQKIGEEIVNG